jgi:hypothetical protein
MLEYSEYKSLVDILEHSNPDTAYTDLMNKENKVLDTVNGVINHYKDKKVEEKQFIHMSLYEIYNLFFLEMPEIMKELEKSQNVEDVMKILFLGKRVIYIGIMLVLISIILFFVNSSI